MWQNGNQAGGGFGWHRHNDAGLWEHSEPMYRCIQPGRGLYVRLSRAMAEQTWRKGKWRAEAQHR